MMETAGPPSPAPDPVADLCARLGLDPESPRLMEALTHPSFANEQRDPNVRDNQRLEFLGDAVLGLCVSDMLMTAFERLDEGQLTVMRASLVNADALAQLARDVGLDRALRLGRGADATGERHRTHVLADALEAVVGSAYVDRGLAGARDLVSRLFGTELKKLVASGGIQRDAKSRLQEMVQARGLPAPRYRVIAEEGPPHERRFTVQVAVTLDQHAGGEGCQPEPVVAGEPPRWKLHCEGSGRSKKLAEQDAAGAALAALRAHPPKGYCA